MFGWRRAVLKAGVGALCAVAGPLPVALAAWSADVGRDQTGRIKVTLTADIDGVRSLYATCNTSRSTVLAVLVPATDQPLNATGMTLSFTFADGSRWAAHAALYRYDNDLVAVSYGNANDVPAIVDAAARARDAVRVAVEMPADSAARAWTVDVRGSTAAARSFLDNCFPTN